MKVQLDLAVRYRRFVQIVLVAFVIAMCGSPAAAQSYVFNAASFAAGGGPAAVAAGDLNGDGKTDLVTVGFGARAGIVSVLLGKPDGSFAPHVDYATGFNPKAVVVADFNHDGHLDIATANLDGNSVSILLGNGNGTFRAHVDYPVGQSPQSIVAGDFNKDGKLDLAIANYRSNTVSILLGNGDGTFQPHVDYTATRFGGPYAVVMGDFNKDGNADLAVVNDVGDSVGLLFGNGNGTFQAPVEYPAGFDAHALVAGDFNRDGNLDIAVADTSLSGAQVSIFLGNGDGTLQTRVDYPIAGAALSLLAADFNGDGFLDLAAGTTPNGGPSLIQAGGTMSVLLGNGDGSFQSHRDFGGVTFSYSMVAADINGDNQPDIALVAPDQGTVNVLLGDGHGNFGSVIDMVLGTGVVQLLAGDFNNDGKLDMAFNPGRSGPISVALGNGDGTFQPPLNNRSQGGPGAVVAGYFNADQNLDVAAVLYSQFSPVVLLGNGDGTFGPSTAYTVPFATGAIVTGDFTGDGIPDLVVPGSGILSVPSLNVLPGKGDGTFITPIASPGGSNAAVAGDFNNDRKLDYAGLQGNNTVGIFLGNGDGSFQPEVDYPIGTAYTAPVALAADYLDGNGSLDLAVANAATSNVSVLLGNGDGSFQPSVEYPTSFGPSAVTTGDIDGDGKVDLLVTGNNGVSILRGNGDGTFKPFVGYATRGGTIVAGHFISNSRLDFATATQYNSNVFSFFVNSSAVALAPSRLAFGVQAGTNGNQRLVTVFNPGIVPLNIQNIVASGEFAQTNNCPSALAAGANCRITAKFVPTNSGLQQGTITITDDSPSSPHVIPLQGDAAAISMSPPFLSFGIVRIGHSASRTVTLMNLSNFAVPFYGVTIRGTRLSGGFSQTNNCGNSIPASGHCQLTITFAPMNASLEIAGATIFDRDIVPRQTIALRGIGHR